MEEEYSAASGAENPLGEKLNQMLSDPESMARLAQMASSLAKTGLFDSLGQSDAPEPIASEATQTESAGAVAASAPQEKQRNVSAAAQLLSGKNRHTALLRALKPYVGAEKRDRIDRMLKLLQLADVAGVVLYSEKE